MNLCVKVGARGSPLSQKQVFEVLREINAFYPHVTFDPIWMKTTGDKDQKTSLRFMENSDFFTKELDFAQLADQFRLSIHSAKDLPIPLAKGLTLIALTQGLDPSDSLVLAQDRPIKKIATSSLRREEAVRQLYPDVEIVDIRGTIEQRLSQIQTAQVDGVVVAECALIRLNLTHLHRLTLSGPTARFQGQLAVLAKDDDEEMIRLFSCIDSRRTSCITNDA